MMNTNVLCLDFLNSEFRDFRGRWVNDQLLDPQWISAFLLRWNMKIETQPDAETLQTLMELRTLMTLIIARLPDSPPIAEELNILNQFMQYAPPIPHLSWNGERYQIELITHEHNWRWVMAEIATSFADVLVNSDIRRLKICGNPHCRWIFYDESKSRTKRYCTNDKCGNLMKLRRFRARHK